MIYHLNVGWCTPCGNLTAFQHRVTWKRSRTLFRLEGVGNVLEDCSGIMYNHRSLNSLYRAVPRIFCLRGQTPQTFTEIPRTPTGFLVKHYVRKKNQFSWRGQLPPPAPTLCTALLQNLSARTSSNLLKQLEVVRNQIRMKNKAQFVKLFSVNIKGYQLKNKVLPFQLCCECRRMLNLVYITGTSGSCSNSAEHSLALP